MADPPSPDTAKIPSAMTASKPAVQDHFHPITSSSARQAQPERNGEEDGERTYHDYTENAPQAVVDAIAIERAREEKEAPPDMMVGSFQSWAGPQDDGGIYPSSITRTPLRAESRRASIVSRRSGSFGPRASASFMRPSASQLDLDHGMQSPSSGVFYVDSEDEGTGPSSRAHAGVYSPAGREARRRDSKRNSRIQSQSIPQGGYFGYQPASRNASRAGSPEQLISPIATSPHRPSTTLGKIASYIGFRQDNEEEEAERHVRGRRRIRRRSGSRSRSRSETGSFTSSREGTSEASTSEESWGYNDDDDDDYSDRPDGEEGYTSSLADDTSLPPNSRPGSPHLPLIPTGTDAVFGEHGRGAAGEDEPKDFTSIAIPSRQTILLPDEDLSIRFTGYRTDPFRNALWWAGCILSFGILGLVGRWIPSTWVKFVGKETSFDEAREGSWVVVETPYGDLHIIPLQIIAYPYPLSTVFPQALPLHTASSSQAPSMRNSVSNAVPSGTDGSPIRPPQHALQGEPDGGVGAAKDLNQDLERGKTTWEETMGFLKVMEYRYTRFALEPGSGRWAMIRDWRDPRWTSARSVALGLPDETRTQRRVLMGENIIDIASKSVFGLLVDEVLHPFYVFQIASIVLWSIDDYYYYAFAIAVISIASVLSTLIETKRTIERMREMSRFHCDVRVLVNGDWAVKDCANMVPGDIFDASDPDLSVFPCDAVLLSGDAIVNESMLTGESVPVSKVPVKDENLRAMSREAKHGSSEVDSELAKHYLFSGTKIIRVRAGARPPWAPKSEEPVALAMVTRTGFNTTKGALVRSMLFPKPMGFKFYRDSMNFIGVLTVIAGLGFAVSAVGFIKMGIAWETILLRALDLITIVVPPALPATLTIGTTFAIERLRKSQIFCISPNRVNIGGKINVICFDKTGTLTEDGLDVLGVRTIDRADKRFSELHSEIADVPISGGSNGKTPLLYALATCHALRLINGEIIGDPLDIKMFEYTGWTLDEGQSRPVTAKGGNGGGERPQSLVQTVVRPPGTDRWRLEDAMKTGSKHAHFLELGVIRTYDFVSALRRMSVIVKRLKSSSMEIYVKGAPEVMPEICDPASFPLDYEDMLSYYTRNGYRVIAIAGKSMEGLTWLKAQRMRREVAESDLQFLGFIVFENKLKPGTAPNIHTLRAAHLACRMVTGDNVRTAISVARECGLVSHSASVYIPTFVQGAGNGPHAQLDWSSVDDESHKLDEYTLKPVIAHTDGMAMDAGEMDMNDYQLAVTGDVFKWMLDFAQLETMERMLTKGVIFARMSPDEKAELVERLQGLGYTVAFCGDGANDCGALKAADVGVSLSEAEASVAAPFTSRSPDISCMTDIIKEGRAALVTSFSCFKYMALYSMIQFTTVTLLYSFASSLGDFQFLYIDLFVIIPIAVAMGRTLPYPKIHHKRPTASLVSRKVLTSIIGQIVINSAIQVIVFIWVRQQPWYTEPDVNSDKLETFNYENSALFLISCFQYILVAAVFSVGPPFRKPIYTNPSLLLCFIVLGGFSTYVLLSPARPIALVLDLIDFTLQFKLELLMIAAINIAACFAFDRYAEKPISRLINQTKRAFRRRERGRRHGEGYKSVPEREGR